MTPIERIRRDREMIALARELDAPRPKIGKFPRNGIGVLLTLLAISPLLEKALADPTAGNILGYAVICAGFGLALLSIAHGEKLQADYDGRHVAFPSVVPFKMVGAGGMGLTAGFLTVFEGGSLAQSIALVPIVSVLACISFGRDPRRVKGLACTNARNIYRLEKIVAHVGVEMERINRSASGLAVPEVMAGLRALDQGVSELLDTVSRDPSRLGTVRKHFGIYLTAISDAARQFAVVYAGTGDLEKKAEFVTLLNTLADSYQKHARHYAAAGGDQLEIEMDVLNGYLRAD